MPFVFEIGAAIFALAGSFITSAAVVQAVVGIGLSVAAGYLIQALTPKPTSPDTATTTVSGVQFERQYGSNVSRQVAAGLVGMAGHDTYVNTYLEANKNMQQIFTLSDYYSTELTRVWINGELATLGTETGIGWPVTNGDYAGLITIKFLDGRQTSTVTDLVDNSNPAGRWIAENIGLGITAVMITLVYDQEKNANSPSFFFEFKGAPFYDWRKDDTVGGSGAHRWADITTHEFTKNPIVVAYNYRRGLKVNDDFFCGMDMPASDLPLVQWSAAANICDELNVDDGLPRYEVSIILDCMAQHSENLQALALSCGAMDIDGVDGSWPLVGSDQASVLEFTDDDIISVANNFRRTEKRSMSELVNSVAGNNPNPDQQWSMIGYEAQIASSYVTIDRRTRDLSIDFPQVANSRQAAQLAFIYLYENRYEARATVTLRPRYQALEAGDWLDWNSARYGLKTFIVVNKQLLSLESDGPRNTVLQLQERNGAIYDGITPPPIFVPTPNDLPIYLAEVDSFVLIPVNIVGADGRAQPAIRVSWDVITDVTVIGVDLIYYPVSDSGSVIHKTVGRGVTVTVLAEGIVRNTLYEVRAKLLTDPLRTTVYNAGDTVTTNDIGTSLGDLNIEIQYQLTTLQELFNDRLSQFEALVTSLGMNQDARNWLDKKSIRSQLAARSDAADAAIEEVRIVAVDASAAFASYSLTITATYGVSANASVAVIASSIATLDGYAASEYSITLDVNGYATGFNLFNGGAGVSIAGFVADKFYVAFPGVTGGAAVQVFTIGNVAGVAKLGFRGDMFIDGTINALAMNVTQLSAITVKAGTITAGVLRDTASKMIIDLNNQRIEIWD